VFVRAARVLDSPVLALEWIAPARGRTASAMEWSVRAAPASAHATERNSPMPEQRIPRPDGGFTAWSARYSESVKKFWRAHGLDDTDLKPLEEGQAAWAAAYAKSVQAEAAYHAALEAKRAARTEFEAAIRPVSAFIQTYFKTTDADRATIGITVRDASPTPGGAPATAPLVSIKLGERLKHTLRIVDADTPLRLAKPRGVRGCEVWMKLVDHERTLPTGDAPDAPLGDPFLSDPATFTYQGTATRAHHDTQFPLEARGKSAIYMLRWVSTRGAPGPWSEVASATIAA